MTLWTEVAWLLGGAAVGTPISSAMGTLPEKTGRISLRQARENAKYLTEWGVMEFLRDVMGRPHRRRQKRGRADDDALGFFCTLAVVVLVAVRVYAEHAEVIAVVLFWLSVLSISITSVVFGVLYLRQVFDGHGTSWLLFLKVCYAAVGVIIALWLVDPPMHAVLSNATSAWELGGPVAFAPYVLPLGLQALGALSTGALLLSSVALCVANIASVLMASGGWGGQSLWPVAFWATRWVTSTWAPFLMGAFAVLALLSASGQATDWALDFARWIARDTLT